MARWAGKIGFAVNTEDVDPITEKGNGVWREELIERNYYGDITRNIRRLQSSGNLNDNISISNELSIVADPFVNENFHAIRYIYYMGTKWKVNSVEVQYPRLILSFGEVYNE